MVNRIKNEHMEEMEKKIKEKTVLTIVEFRRIFKRMHWLQEEMWQTYTYAWKGIPGCPHAFSAVGRDLHFKGTIKNKHGVVALKSLKWHERTYRAMINKGV